ncbi:MAG: Na+/H+ antiporter NhaC family protein [Flavobacteriales bacterium]|nr:Na+/H+ antiporter NhaC family protein [Flavobacteriales bacterium]
MAKAHNKFFFHLFLVASLLLSTINGFAGGFSSSSDIEIIWPGVIMEGFDYEIGIRLPAQIGTTIEDGKLKVNINGKDQIVEIERFRPSSTLGIRKGDLFKGWGDGEFYEGTFELKFEETTEVTIQAAGASFEETINPIPIWTSILPPLVAILMAMFLKEVISSLFMGMFVGVAISAYYSSGLIGIIAAPLTVLDTYIMYEVFDLYRAQILAFSFLIGATICLVARSAGMSAMINTLSKYAKNAKSTQLTTAIMGIAVYFDDYTNCLITGNTMRRIGDKMRISREKMAYIVDCTSSPVVMLTIITTWVGFLITCIEDGTSGVESITESGYSILVNSLAYMFYPIFALIFLFTIILSGRDFGPMYDAEVKARLGSSNEESDNDNEADEQDDMAPIPGVKPNLINAIIPIGTMVLGIILGMLYTGWDSALWNDDSLSFTVKLSTIIGQSDSYVALLWATLSSTGIAILMYVGQKIMTLSEAIGAAFTGQRLFYDALVMLVLAWALSSLVSDMHTAEYISSLLLQMNLSYSVFPAIVFVLCAIIAFSTGSSWGVMALLHPLATPAMWTLCMDVGLGHAESMDMVYNVVACVFCGAVCGENASPLADTMILSTMSCKCNHIEHVRTMAPYTFTAGLIACLLGVLPAGYGTPFFITLPLGAAAIYAVIRFVGKKVEEVPYSPIEKG